MRFFRPMSWLLLLLVVAAPAAAQRSPAFLLNGGARGLGGLQVGGSFDFYSTQFELALAASSGSMRLVGLAGGDLASTYGMRFRGWDQSLASERYRAAAFLATQISDARPDEAHRLNRAIWNLMGMTDLAEADFALGGDPKVQLRMQESLLAANTVDATQWTIASDVPVAGSARSELLVQNLEQTEQSVVPEPEVIILLASGLLALGAAAYFRGTVA
jgi:hypothetical protein